MITTPRLKKEPHRIPYYQWADSQLSIAKYYGGAIINGKQYVLDYDNCRTEGEGDDKRYFPDLVEVINQKKPKGITIKEIIQDA
jgi:hypothetical protein